MATAWGLASRRLGASTRVINALQGVLPSLIAVPLVLRVWSPTWFVITWIATYLIISVLFATLSLVRPSNLVEQGWTITASMVFAVVPISATVWSGSAQDFWTATTVGILFIAFEVSTLPFLPVGEWRAGVLLVATAIIVCGVLTVNPIVALTLAPVLLAMILGADRIRSLRTELEQNLDEAHRTIHYDPLTGLLNRRGLAAAIETLDGQQITVALIDVDRFKIINDSHGHQFGDEVLITLAHELSLRLGDQFALARLGGDEFVAVASSQVQLDNSLAAPRRIETRLHKQKVVVDCAFSIGVSYGENVDSAERLLSEAGFAMRDAKRSGATLAHFDQDLAERLDLTVQLAALAGGADDSGAFEPFGQTVVDGDRIVGCELLIRWRCADGRLLNPGQFLPLATEAGLMSAINELMLEHAVRFAARFNNRPAAPFVAVNITASHLGEPAFFENVQTLLAEYRVPAERLMIEITESEQLGGNGSWETAAERLRSLGVSLAIDDFGTGYSSLERLQHLPVSHLKFDRTLVTSVSGPVGEIVGGVTRFAKAINIGIIAEGIETLDELESMRAFGITTFQGFLFHRPAPLDEVEVLLIEDHLRTTAEVTTGML